MILVDQLRKDGWCHMICSDLEHLHRFAKRIGLRRSSFHVSKNGGIPHYDLRKGPRGTAIAHGAIPVNAKTLVAYYRTGDPEVVYQHTEGTTDELRARVAVFSDYYTRLKPSYGGMGFRQPIQDKYRHPHNHSLEDLEKLRPIAIKVYEESGPVPKINVDPVIGSKFGSTISIFQGPRFKNVDMDKLSPDEIGRLIKESDGVIHREQSAGLMLSMRFGSLPLELIDMTKEELNAMYRALDESENDETSA